MLAEDEKTLAGLLLALGVVLALYVPDISHFFAPYLLPSLFFVMVFSLLPFARLEADRLFSPHPMVVSLIFWQQFLLPMSLVVIGKALQLEQQTIYFIVLTVTSGSLFASPTLVQLMGLDQRVAVQTVVLSTLAAPASIFLFFSFLHVGPVDLNLVSFAERLLLFLVLPIGIFMFMRRLVSKWDDRRKDLVDQFGRWGSVISLIIFCFALEDQVTYLMEDNLDQVIEYLLIAIMVVIFVAVTTRIVMARFGPIPAATATVLASFRNVGLTFGLVGPLAGPEVAAYVGVCQIPMFCAPLLFDLFFKKAMGQRIGAEEADAGVLEKRPPATPTHETAPIQALSGEYAGDLSIKELGNLIADLRELTSNAARSAMNQPNPGYSGRAVTAASGDAGGEVSSGTASVSVAQDKITSEREDFSKHYAELVLSSSPTSSGNLAEDRMAFSQRYAELVLSAETATKPEEISEPETVTENQPQPVLAEPVVTEHPAMEDQRRQQEELDKKVEDARALLSRLEAHFVQAQKKVAEYPKLFVSAFLLILIAGIAGIWNANKYFYPMLFDDALIEQVAEAHTAGRNFAVFDLNINIRDLRNETIKRMDRTPEVVVFGASHWQEAHVDLMPGYDFYNSHVHRDYYEDMMAVTEMWVRHDKLPKEIILTIRDNLLTPVAERTDFLWLPGIKYYHDFAERIGYEPHAYWETMPVQTWRELVSLPLLWPQAKRHLTASLMPHPTNERNFETLDTLLPGGSILWSGEHQRLFNQERARNEALAFANARRNDPPKIDPKGIEHMETLFQYLKDQGVKVTLAHPQFNPIFWDAVQDSPYMEGLKRIENLTKGWAEKYGFGLIGGFSPESVGCRAEQYIDAEHGNPECLGMLLAQYGSKAPEIDLSSFTIRGTKSN